VSRPIVLHVEGLRDQRDSYDARLREGLPPLEVLAPGEASCPGCGSEVRLPGFCATCHEAPPACWLCDGTGQVEIERDVRGRPVLQACMACVNTKEPKGGRR
jgi:hypothetical protein